MPLLLWTSNDDFNNYLGKPSSSFLIKFDSFVRNSFESISQHNSINRPVQMNTFSVRSQAQFVRRILFILHSILRARLICFSSPSFLTIIKFLSLACLYLHILKQIMSFWLAFLLQASLKITTLNLIQFSRRQNLSCQCPFLKLFSTKLKKLFFPFHFASFAFNYISFTAFCHIPFSSLVFFFFFFNLNLIFILLHFTFFFKIIIIITILLSFLFYILFG